MDERARTALEGSIEKWRRIVAREGRDEGINNCPLCKEFFLDDCRGCPVSERTGQTLCGGTPYDDKWGDLNDQIYAEEPYTDEMIEVAREELRFLESLRE